VVMAHPRMYAEDDPHLAELREVCLALPESVEVEAWGRPTFRAGKKLFAVFDGDDDHRFAVVFKPDPAERPALLADPRFYVPPTTGRAAGWRWTWRPRRSTGRRSPSCWRPPTARWPCGGC
jgi:YjbR